MAGTLDFKQALVGTALGRLASSARDWLELMRSPRIELGTAVNDQMAIRLLVGLCRSGDVFLDIGSHIGSVIAKVRHQCPSATVIGFEAIPEKADKLRRKFPTVRIECCALSDREGETSFFVDTQESGYSSLADRPGRSREIKVAMRRLDDVLDGQKIDLVKLDVEGAELGVLRGAVEIVRRNRPVIAFESGPGDVLGYTKGDMFDWFAALDYGIMVPNRVAHTGGPMTLDAFIDSHEYPRRTTNYIAIPSEKFEEVRRRAKQLQSDGVIP